MRKFLLGQFGLGGGVERAGGLDCVAWITWLISLSFKALELSADRSCVPRAAKALAHFRQVGRNSTERRPGPRIFGCIGVRCGWYSGRR